MKFALKNIVLTGALLAASLVGAEQASAMPVAPEAGFAASSAPIEQAGWRCGSPYLHMNPWGRCVPNGGVYRPYGVYRRPYGVYRRPYGVYRRW